MQNGATRPATVNDAGLGGLQLLVDAGPARFVVDQPTALGGLDLGPTPHELVSAALAACTAQTLRLYAQRKAWPLGRVEVTVTSVHDPARTPAERFERRVVVGGPLDAAQLDRLRAIANMCPVHRLLTNGAQIETSLVPDPDSTVQPAASPS
jgi:putative redox protein